MKKIITSVFTLSLILQSIAVNSQDASTRGVGVNPTNKNKPKTGNTYALIIGINYPEDNMYSRLNFAVSDAQLMKAFLQSGLFFDSIPNDNIRLILDEDATAMKIFYGIDWLKNAAKKGDRAIIYFAGHGVAAGPAKAYLLGYNAPKVSDPSMFGMAGGTYQVYDLKTDIAELKNKSVTTYLIIDACRSNEKNSDSQTNFQNIIEENKGEIQFSASSRNQSSMEDKKWGGGHGLFTYYLIKGLSGYADDESDTKDGVVTLSEIKAYVEKHVRNDSRNLVTNEVRQMPYINITNAEDQEQAFAYVKPGVRMKDQFQEGNLLAVANRGMAGDTSSLMKNYFAALQNKRFFPEEPDNAFNLLQQIKIKENESRYTDAMQEYVIQLVNDAQIRINKYFEGVDSNYNNRYFGTGARELNIALGLMSKQHPLYRPYDINRLFMEAVSLRKSSLTNLAKAKLDSAIALDSSLAYLYYAKGVFESDNQKWKPAMAYFEKAHSMKPDWWFPIDNLAVCYENLKQYNEAKKVYVDALKRDSTNSEAWNYLGTFYADRVTYDTAIACFQKALKYNPNNVSAAQQLGNVYLKTNQDEKANQMLWHAIQINPRNSLSWQYLGYSFYYRKKYDSAIAYLRKSTEVDPSYVYGYRTLAIIYDNLGEDELAKQMYRTAINVDTLEERNWKEFGEFFQIRKQYDSAIYFYKRALAIDAGYYGAISKLAEVYTALHEDEKVKTVYLNAVRADSLSARNWNILGFYYKDNDIDSAIYCYQRALKLQYNYLDALTNLADVYKGMNQDNKALECFRQAVRLDPSDATSWDYIGIFYYDRKMYDSAIYYYEKAFAADPSFTTALGNIELVYRAQGNEEMRKQTYLRLIQADPLNVDNWNSLGTFFYDKKEYDSALVYYKRCVKMDPYSSYAYYNVALCYHYRENNSLDTAKYFYKKSLEVDKRSFSSYVQLAIVFDEQARLDSAFYYLRTGLKLDDKNEEIIKKMVVLNFDHEKYDSTFTYMKKLYNGADLFDSYNSPLANMDSTKMLKYYKQVMKMTPVYDTLLLGKVGTIYYQMHRYDSALYFYQKALTKSPGEADMYFNIAKIYADELNNKDKAYSFYRQFIRDSYESYSSATKRDEAITFVDAYLLNKNQLQEYSRFYKDVVGKNIVYAYSDSNYYFDRLINSFVLLGQKDSVEIYSKIAQLETDYVKSHLKGSASYYLSIKDAATAVTLLKEAFNLEYYKKKFFKNYKVDTSLAGLLTICYLRLNKKDSAEFYANNYLLVPTDSYYGRSEEYFALVCYYASKNDNSSALTQLQNYFYDMYDKKEAMRRIDKEELLNTLRKDPDCASLLKQYR